jgi:TldD protein
MTHLAQLVKTLSDVQLPVEYWDVRIEDTFETNIQLLNGEVVTCSSSPSVGAFIRVRKEGFWFYESTTDLSQLKSTLENLSRKSVHNVVQSGKFEPAPAKLYSAIHSAEAKFSAVPLERKLQLCQHYDRLLADQRNVKTRIIRYKDVYKVKSFLNSVGTQFEYDFNQGGATGVFVLKEQERLFEDVARIYASKFEDLKGKEGVFKSAVDEGQLFLNAPAIDPGKYKVILDSECTGVFTHESFGHKSEADGMVGNAEALQEWKLGKKIASDNLTIVDYGAHAGTSGYCPIDDEGTPARKNYLIKNGILTGRLHSRDTAGHLNEEPTGNARALNFEFEPIVRMTSTYIEPGSESIHEILPRMQGAILVEGVRHGSGLSTFTIAPTRGYRIGANGSKEPVRLTVISGSVFETLKNIEAVSSDFHLHNSAIGGCGKMDQAPLPVADGGPFVVVSEMQVS